MEVWQGIKELFKKPKIESPEINVESKAKEEAVGSTETKDASPSFAVQDKPLLKNKYTGEVYVCELCNKPINEGEQKTFNSKKVHIVCFRKGIKAYRKKLGF